MTGPVNILGRFNRKEAQERRKSKDDVIPAYTLVPKEIDNKNEKMRREMKFAHRDRKCGTGGASFASKTLLLDDFPDADSTTESIGGDSLSTISFSLNGSTCGGADEAEKKLDDAMNGPDLYGFSSPVQTVNDDDHDDYSTSESSDTSADVMEKLTMLKERLRVQEITKVELLNRCMLLQKKAVESEANPPAFMNVLIQENKQLKATIQDNEEKFASDLNEIVHKMDRMNSELAMRDDKIAMLEEELNMLGCGELDFVSLCNSRTERH